ncbi:MAG TPA: AAA family ATPase [Candidatus Diapherotrites archaeon]|uniref:AAA family ATPase n=1 Tax=Candidatus Iainarchaeum sp. TaxID=3101447 RepID=A0A7J4JMV0_9ARCH|nr:AAA family ATPase [Candidatus Diapherotrites archaeon]HIH16566.1 AAA family ATPase [Candidatus Diapherotrites archaeon]
MKVAITGSPGVGKTSVARLLAKRLKCPWLNERAFAVKKGIGAWDVRENEFVVPLAALRRELNLELRRRGRHQHLVVEGHLLCETRLDVDVVVVLRVHPEVLEARLEHRGYRAEKIQDNVFCEGIDYCLKHALRKYGKKKVLEVQAKKGIKETMQHIISGLRARGFLK